MKPNQKQENPWRKVVLRAVLTLFTLGTAFVFGIFLSGVPSWSAWMILCISVILIFVLGIGVSVEDIYPDSAIKLFVAGFVTQFIASVVILIYFVWTLLGQLQKPSVNIPVESRNLTVPLALTLGFLAITLFLTKYCIHFSKDKHAAVITSIGNRKRISLRALFVVWPIIQQLEFRNLGPKNEALDIECVTHDRITVTFQAKVEWQEDAKHLLHIIKNQIKGNEVLKSKMETEVKQETNKHPLDELMSKPKLMQGHIFRLLSHQLTHDTQKYGITVRSVKITIKLSDELTNSYAARKQMQIQEELAESFGKQEANKLREINQIAASASGKTLEHLENMKNAESGMLNRK